MRTNVRPLNYFRLTYAPSVVKVSGVYQTLRSPSGDLLTGVEGVDWFLGGRRYTVSMAVAADLVAAGYLVDYILNPSFEEGTSSWSFPAGFTGLAVSTEAHAGNQSLQVTHATGTDPSPVTQTFSVAASSSYQLKVWVKFPATSFTFPLIDVDVDGAHFQTETMTGGDWEQITVNFTTTPGVSSAILKLHPAGEPTGSSTTYFDDITLTKVS